MNQDNIHFLISSGCATIAIVAFCITMIYIAQHDSSANKIPPSPRQSRPQYTWSHRATIPVHGSRSEINQLAEDVRKEYGDQWIAIIPALNNQPLTVDEARNFFFTHPSRNDTDRS